MNTVAYVLRLCCGGAEAARLPALGKAAASHQGCREHPAERPGGDNRPSRSPPGGDKGWEGAVPPLPYSSCASPQIHIPPGPLWGWRQWGCPCPAPHGGGTPGGRRFPDSRVPGGMSSKTARSGPSPPGAVSSGRGRRLSAVSINSPCPARPRARGGWAGRGWRTPMSVPPAGVGETRCSGEASRGSACFS